MRVFRRRVFGLAIPLFALLSFPAHSQNLLLNPGFDRDLSGWTVAMDASPPGRPDVYASAAWSASDAQGSASSGSAEFRMNATLQSNATASLSQCVAVGPSTRYAGYARVRVANQLNATVRVLIDFFDGPGCAGSLLQDPNATSDWALAPLTFRANDSGGAWLPGSASATPPAGAVSARLSLRVAGSGTFYASQASFAGNVDDAFFGVAPVVTRIVPIVLDVTTNTARYTTELTFTNDTAGSLSVSALYTPSLGMRYGGGTIQDTLAAGEQKRIPDVLAWLRAKGLEVPLPSDDPSQGGTLKLDFAGAAAEPGRVSALARTGSDTRPPQPPGRAGTAYPGFLLSEASPLAWVYTVSNESDRTNLGIVNASGAPVTLDVALQDLSERGVLSFDIVKGLTLGPWGWTQIDSPSLLDANGSRAGRASVTASGPVYAYAVINDRRTNDGSVVVANSPLRSSSEGFTVAVETPGFVTEAVLFSSGSPISMNGILLNYTDALGPVPGAGAETVLPPPFYGVMLVPDVIDRLRGVANSTIGSAGAGPYAGVLATRALYGGGSLVRTVAPSPAGGRFGVHIPTVGSAGAASVRAAVYGLVSDDRNRSNVALMNVGGSQSGPVTLRLQVHDGASGGAAKGAPFDVTLSPGGWKQLNGVLRDAGVTEGWVEITRLSGTAVWLAYGVVNDGAYPGERTGDGAYVPMSK